MDARVDRGVGTLSRVHLPHDGQPWVEVGQPPGGQRAAPRRKLQERLPFLGRHPHQHVDEPQEPGTVK